jgi:hypothetical protein
MCSLKRLAAALDLLGAFLLEQTVQPVHMLDVNNNTVGATFNVVPVGPSHCYTTRGTVVLRFRCHECAGDDPFGRSSLPQLLPSGRGR